MSAVRGLVVGVLALSALEVAVTDKQANDHANALIKLVSGGMRRWLKR